MQTQLNVNSFDDSKATNLHRLPATCVFPSVCICTVVCVGVFHSFIGSMKVVKYKFTAVCNTKLQHDTYRIRMSHNLHIKELKHNIVLSITCNASKFQLIVRFKIDLKELTNSAILSTLGRLFQSKAP